jgi:Pyridoxamine 5'-phosphate oxidase
LEEESMAIATRLPKPVVVTASETGPSHVTSEQVWHELDRASFAVVGYVTPAGEPRSSGVVYKTAGKRLFVAVAPESWKARHIAAARHVSVTVPVRRGGILALVQPIPPATISFHATAIVHPAGSVKVSSLSKELDSLLPSDRREAAVVIELTPEGQFLTYGVGVRLMDLQKPELARGIVPTSS